MNRPLQAVGGSLRGHAGRVLRAAGGVVLLALAAIVAGPSGAAAAPFIWDQDDDRLDDRIESVHLLGYTFAFEGGDTLLHQRIDVTNLPGGLVFGVYVVFDHVPTATDIASMALLGMPVLHRFESVPALRSIATFAQAQAAAALAGVERVEAVPVLYPMLRESAADIAVRDPSDQVFPTWAGAGGGDGSGIAIAILDTGVNDAPDGGYPGHESLLGRALGGAVFVNADSITNTGRDASVNPVDRGGAVTQAHGTHVAGIALGTGGPSGYAIGVAPGARFVDVKVLNDAGVGTSVAEALDWCVHNRARNWGVPGYEGIDVINLALSSTDESDGNDIASRIADRAVQEGIVVVASTGNEGRSFWVPSPAGAARVIAVGAMDAQRTPKPSDDQWVSFSDYGPRAADGDFDPSDEQKPDLLAPGISVLSADGSLSSDGAQYRRLSGTSMSAAFVSGVAAALKGTYPSLTPAALVELLRATARRTLGGMPSGTVGADPRWRSPRGFGIVDLHAARLELEQPGRSQIERLELTSSATQVTAVLRTQREMGATHFVFERAPDIAGSPGAFAAVDSVLATGTSSLAGADNRESYARTWTVPSLERGLTFWYRVAYTEGAQRYASAARAFRSPVGPSAATIELTVVHNAYDQDVTGTIHAGSASVWTAPLPATGAAASSEWITGLSTTGNVAWTWRIEVPAGAADATLPPTSGNPWWLQLNEGGYVNRSGRLEAFRLVWHAPGGDVTYTGGPVPHPTLEGSSLYAAVPQGTVDVAPTTPELSFRAGPNPVASGAGVTFRMGRTEEAMVRIFDLAGREIGRAPIATAGSTGVAHWEARDPSGEPLASGIYLARAGRSQVARLVVIRR